MREGFNTGARRLLGAAAAFASLLVPAPAPSVPAAFAVVTEAYTYVPGDAIRPTADLTITKGSTLTLLNVDPVGGEHSVTADAFGADGNPLFDSPLIDNPGQTQVRGVERLAPGTYPFHCSIHWFIPMQGVLHVVD